MSRQERSFHFTDIFIIIFPTIFVIFLSYIYFTTLHLKIDMFLIIISPVSIIYFIVRNTRLAYDYNWIEKLTIGLHGLLFLVGMVAVFTYIREQKFSPEVNAALILTVTLFVLIVVFVVASYVFAQRFGRLSLAGRLYEKQLQSFNLLVQELGQLHIETKNIFLSYYQLAKLQPNEHEEQREEAMQEYERAWHQHSALIYQKRTHVDTLLFYLTTPCATAVRDYLELHRQILKQRPVTIEQLDPFSQELETKLTLIRDLFYEELRSESLNREIRNSSKI